MTRTFAYCCLVAMVAAVVCVAAFNPSWINDKNTFLAAFVNHEFLALLGVIVSITLASMGQLHLTLNEIEKSAKERFLFRIRRNVKSSAYALIFLFLVGFVIVILKGTIVAPNGDGKDHPAIAFLNGFAIVVVVWTLMILASIMQVVFAITPRMPADD